MSDVTCEGFCIESTDTLLVAGRAVRLDFEDMQLGLQGVDGELNWLELDFGSTEGEDSQKLVNVAMLGE